jgi:hypothetical protein
MTAQDLAPQIATMRRQVVTLMVDAQARLLELDALKVKIDGFRHDQQSLRGALSAILDTLDRIAPLGNASTTQE